MKNLGIIADDLRPTVIANRWRDDGHYGEACLEILKKVAPKELIDSFPPPNPDPAEVSRWFALKAGLGEAAAKNNANFYSLLAGGRLSDSKDANKKTGGEKPVKVVAKSPVQIKRPVVKLPNDSTVQYERSEGERSAAKTIFSPSLQLNIEIHISSQVTPEQIDAIFASMAKHLAPK